MISTENTQTHANTLIKTF